MSLFGFVDYERHSDMRFILSQFNRFNILILLLPALFGLSTITSLVRANAYDLAQCPPLTLTPASLSDGTTGVPYSQNLDVNGVAGGRYTFTIIANALPPGLNLNSTTGAITGVPTTTGKFNFIARAVDPNGCSAQRIYTVTVNCGSLTFTPDTLPSGQVGTPYSQTVNAGAGRGPYTYAITFGNLPTGLTLDSNTGRISGISGAGSAATWLFDVTATDANPCSTTKRYSITLTCPTIDVNPKSLTAVVNSSVNLQLNATGGKPPYTFTLRSASMPAGLTLSSSGLISGTPTNVLTQNIDIDVRDSNHCSAPLRMAINIVACPVVTVSPTSLPSGTAGVLYTQTFSSSGGTAPYSYGTNISALPPGLLFNTSGSLSGTPTTPGTYNFIVRSNDAGGCFGERSYTLVINPTCATLTLTPASLPVAQVGIPYSQTFTASGGTAPYTFSLTGGNLPNAVGLVSNGAIMGNPTTAGTYTFSIRATDANGCFVERSYTLTINTATCPSIILNPPAIPQPRLESVYNVTVTATGGTAPYSYSIASGTMPPGLTFSSSGSFNGTPTALGTYIFTIRATDANGCTGERTLTWSVVPCEGITISPHGASLPGGIVGTPYNQVFNATGGTGPYYFSIRNGSFLPPGLSLSSTGLLSGTPIAGGVFNFYMNVISANGCYETELYVLHIGALNCPLILVPPVISTGTIGVSYNQTVSASGGVAPYSYTVAEGSFPPGLVLTLSGSITGIPTTRGNYYFNLRVADANGCTGFATGIIYVNETGCNRITINPSTLPHGTVGLAYSQTFAPLLDHITTSVSSQSGPPAYSYTIVLGVLPAGLSLSSDGHLSGTPTTAGTASFTVRATDANGCSDQANYTLVIDPSTCPTITLGPNALTSGVSGTSYSQAISATGGAAPYTYSISNGTLPGGLSLSPGGNLTGTPAAGSFNFTVKATDANGCTGERSYSLVINNPTCPTITVSPNTLPAAVVGGAYTQAIGAAGGSAPYTINMPSGALPDGLSLSSGGNLTGTLTKSGSFSFVVRATDGNNCAGDRSYTLTIAPGLVTSVSAANFVPSRPLAPESIVAAFGSNLAKTTESALTRPLPTNLAGVKILIKDSAGIERLAPLYFASDRQVNYQVPEWTSLGRATLSLLSENQLTNAAVVQGAGTIDIEPVSPGIFSADATGSGLAAALVFRVKSNGSQSYEAVARYDAAQQRYVAEPIDLGPTTDQVFLVVFGTGFKFRSSLSAVTCTIGGIDSEVLYAGDAPGYTGLEQINTRLSRSLIARGEVDVVVKVEGKQANTVRVAFR